MVMRAKGSGAERQRGEKERGEWVVKTHMGKGNNGRFFSFSC
jgi:hypothetical protein